VMNMTEKYKCPYCGKEFDHLLVYCIHVIEKHEEKEPDLLPALKGEASSQQRR